MKAAIIGCGRMAISHVKALQQLGISLVGAADMQADAAARLLETCNLPDHLAFGDAAQMLQKTLPELVVIATTAPAHAPLVHLAANAGARYILCEKPMAQSLSQCDAMIADCAAASVALAINHQMRFMEHYTRPKAMLHDERHGGLASIHVTAGNFGLAMNGTHYLEMARYLSDSAPAIVWAKFSAEDVPNPRGAQFIDKAGWMVVEMQNGVRFFLSAGSNQGHGLCVNYASRNGQIFIDELTGDMRETVREAAHRALPTTRYAMPHEVQSHHITPTDSLTPTRAVLEALLSGGDYPTGAHGRLALAALVAAYISNERGGAAVAVSEAESRKDEVFPWA